MPRLTRAALAVLPLLLFVAPAVAQPEEPPSKVNPVPPPGTPTVGSTVGAAPYGNDIVSSQTGLNINALLAAPPVYAGGITGARAVVANIELGHAWNGFETLGHVQTFIPNPGSISPTGTPPVASLDGHATAVSHVIGGRPTGGPNPQQQGLAPGATLWSGVISPAAGGNLYNTIVQPYRTALRTGISGVTVDTVNSSWGFQPGFDTNGTSIFARGVDALIRSSAKPVVFSAGNAGVNQLNGLKAGYNGINVAALANDLSTPAYRAPATFSSRGVSDSFVPVDAAGLTGFLFSQTRYRVDIAAPGQNLLLPDIFPQGSPGSPNAYGETQGTSFAAPTVAGVVALMVDAAKANGPASGTDGRVVKAVLLSTADKTPGWNNRQVNVNGVLTTSQALDQAVGAGRVNANAAVDFFLPGTANLTRDVPGTASGRVGAVQENGWDMGRVTQTADNDYALPNNLPGGSRLDVTLTWYANRALNETTLDPATQLENGLADLDLQVWRLDGAGNFLFPVGESLSTFNTTEHLSLVLPADGQYGLRVVYFGDNWNFVGTTSELYGLAWRFTPVPEPAGLLALAAGGLLVVRRVRRKA